MKYFFKMAFLMLLMGCESAGTGAQVTIPSVTINCQDSKCTSAASGSYSVVVNITLSGCAADQIDMSPVVAGSSTVLCTFGTGCTGTVASWLDNNSDSTTQISSRTYSVCGWIDIDNSGAVKNSNDAFSDNNELVTSSTITLTDWGAANFRLKKIF